MSELLPGTRVHARGLHWEVVTTERLGPQTLYRLRGVEGVMQGRELDLLEPFEPIEPIQYALDPEKAGPLRNWLVYHQAFLLEQALGPQALLAVQPGRLRVEPYQLVPVLRAMQMSRPRLLLADGVGLGKTVQAGLILTELMARRIAHRILVVTPAGPLLEQWKTELAERFGLRLDVIDRARLEEIRRSTELGAIAFDHIPLGLVSIDFLKQERVLEQLERSSYDIVVVDEAHHCMDVGGLGGDDLQRREDSQRRRLAEVLARRCDALLLLTATPHDGDDRSFASLCELLDPSLVDGRGCLRGERYRRHVVRRLKRHVPGFRERQVLPQEVTPDPERHARFIELHRELVALVAPELRRAFRAKQYQDVLSFLSLLKRSVSTAAACRSTLEVVAGRFGSLVTAQAESQESRRQRLRTLRDYQRRLQRFGTLSVEEEDEQALLEAEDLAQGLAALEREARAGSRQLSRVAEVGAALDELFAVAAEAAAADPKLEVLADTIASIRASEPLANVLVYTEYTTSQEAAAEHLRNRGVQVVTLRGQDDDRVRREVTDRFRTELDLVLVSTDATAEGLNLHQQCHHLIHLELPFNPNRLEQRNGRIDRYGQTRDPIVRYLYLRGTFEERILLRLISKYERQRRRLTFMPNTLGLTAADPNSRLLEGLLDEEQRLFDVDANRFSFGQANEAEGADEATRDLLDEIDRSLQSYQQATKLHTWLGDAGLNAEQQLADQAEAARERGDQLSSVDLAQFVTNAVLLDGGHEKGSAADETFELVLPPSWAVDSVELPGYDADHRTVRLTTRLEVTRGADNDPVGFLGRAHPLVRQALDRVRHRALGGSTIDDCRVSAVAADVPAPALLHTFLGRLNSEAGRVLERVLAVEVSQSGAVLTHCQSAEWLRLADPKRALVTTSLWTNHFASWADPSDAALAAAQVFASMVEEVKPPWLRDVERELRALADWLSEHVQRLTGDLAQPAQQLSFDEIGADSPLLDAPLAKWPREADPLERLRGFADDRSVRISERGEARALLGIYKQRHADLRARLALAEPDILPLGLLMLVPDHLVKGTHHGA